MRNKSECFRLFYCICQERWGAPQSQSRHCRAWMRLQPPRLQKPLFALKALLFVAPQTYTLSQIARLASEVPREWHLKGTKEGQVSFSTEAFSSLTASFEKCASNFSGDTWLMPSQSEKLRKVSSAYLITSMHWPIKRVCAPKDTSSTVCCPPLKIQACSFLLLPYTRQAELVSALPSFQAQDKHSVHHLNRLWQPWTWRLGGRSCPRTKWPSCRPPSSLGSLRSL